MPCLTLEPFPECGIQGECVDNETLSFCSCKEGWSQSLEFAYFNPSEDIRSGTCFYNQTVIITLYSLVVFFSVSLVLALSCFVETRNQFRRQCPNLICALAMISLGIYRLVKPEEALLGVDILFSVLVSIFLTTFQIGNTVFYNKYVSYLLKKTDFINREKSARRAIILKRITYFHIAFEFANCQLLWICSLTNRQSGMIIIYVFFVGEFCSGLFNIILPMVSLGRLINDMGTFLKHQETLGISAEQQNMAKWVQKYLPKTKQMKNMIIMSRIFFCLIYILSLSSEAVFQSWSYIFPTMMLIILWNYLFSYWKISKKGPKLKISRSRIRTKLKTGTGTTTGVTAVTVATSTEQHDSTSASI